MDRQPLNKFRLWLLTGAILAFGALLTACDKPQAEKTAEAAAQAAADTAQAENGAPASGEMPNITAEDIGNLARAMHGAASQQPDDAPKDKYGRPYIIGNLGGVPVNLPSSVVSLVEYDDSPSWDPEKLRNYNPPTRSYQSVIMSFGFYFFNSDAQLLDDNDPVLRERNDKDWGVDGSTREKVGVHILFEPKYPPKYTNLDSRLARRMDKARVEPPYPNHSDYFEKTAETLYGLEVYINPGTDSKTGKPWREHEDAKDLFVGRDSEGHVQTMIECSNKPIPSAVCVHYFVFPPPYELE